MTIQVVRREKEGIETDQEAANTHMVQIQSQMAEMEIQAQAELDTMHNELLSLRQKCHELQLALKESEAKR